MIDKIVSSVGLNHGSVHSIIGEEFGSSRISARWISQRLSSDKKKPVWLLARHSEEREGFSSRILSCDETWLHHYTPESKQSSKKWRLRHEGARMKAKTQLNLNPL